MKGEGHTTPDEGGWALSVVGTVCLGFGCDQLLVYGNKGCIRTVGHSLLWQMQWKTKFRIFPELKEVLLSILVYDFELRAELKQKSERH